MYVKPGKWDYIIYTPLQDLNAFCSIYCKGSDWIPVILNKMMRELEQEYLEEAWDNISDRERIEITIKAWRKAQEIWNFFWWCTQKITDEWRHPFIIRIRHTDFKED